MGNRFKYLILLLVCAFNMRPFCAYGSEVAHFHYNVRVQNLERQQISATAQLEIYHYFKAEDEFISVKNKAKGQYDHFKDVKWLTEVEMKSVQGDRLVLSSRMQIFDQANQELIQAYQRIYDYDNQKLIYQVLDKEKNVQSEKIFPIKGKICDDQSLPFFLQAHLMNSLEEPFYLLSNEPKLYKVEIIDRGREEIQRAGEKYSSHKFQLRDVNPLSPLAEKFIPSTYVWYENESFAWLQYQGLERGFNSAHVQIQVQPLTQLIQRSQK